jgi:hypothetical protein
MSPTDLFTRLEFQFGSLPLGVRISTLVAGGLLLTFLAVPEIRKRVDDRASLYCASSILLLDGDRLSFL